MAINNSGPVSLGGNTAGESIALELSLNTVAQISLNDAGVRGLAGVNSGAITIPTDFWGKASEIEIQYLVVAGGGGGSGGRSGGWEASGGGAGGVLYSASYNIAGTHTITVGAGGAACPPTATPGFTGNNSSLGTIAVAFGGGFGGSNVPGGSGGSGGGGNPSGSGTPGQGNPGGPASDRTGGGGKGGAGGINIGGIGQQYDITGSNVYYAGGGGPANKGYNPQQGGGGSGGSSGNPGGCDPGGCAGTNGLGGGGGGGRSSPQGGGGAGGSGVVIIRAIGATLSSTTGSPNVTTVGADTVYKFTGSGSITV